MAEPIVKGRICGLCHLLIRLLYQKHLARLRGNKSFEIMKSYGFKLLLVKEKRIKKRDIYLNEIQKQERTISIPRFRESDPFKYPPINQDHFRAVVIDYLMRDYFDYIIPVNEDNVFQLAQKRSEQYGLRQNIMMRKRLEENQMKEEKSISEYCNPDRFRNVSCQRTHFRKIFKAITQTKLGQQT
ncbi:hypothetical protein pb186bvf_005371 [Paramecium bursaria]